MLSIALSKKCGVLLAHTLSITCCMTFLIWVLTFISKHHWSVTFRPLLTQYRWEEGGQKHSSQTYYHRHCDRRDFSTSNFTDLIIKSDWDSTMAAANLLTHGVSVFPNVLDQETSQVFRNFTLERNKHVTSDEMVYVMNAKTKNKQTRWSFAFSAQDHPIISKALQQIAKNDKLVNVLEMFLGKDPSIIKMQTITQRYKAEHQGWHPDVAADASIKSHARNFMMHFSLFIPLQDTTASMGQTGICPGTHYCTSVQDFEIGCKQIVSGKRRDNNQMLWLAGDAVLMNQNTFHRGTKHTDKKGGDRVIIVITFTSRPRFPYGKIQQQRPLSAPLPSKLSSKQTKCPNGNTTISSVDAKNFPIQSWEDEIKKNMYPESRVLSLGTPLTSFGHTLYDMKDSPSSKSTMLNFLRYFGIYKSPEARWGWSYINSVFSRISAESHKFKREDLSGWLSSQKNFIKRNRNSPSYALRFRSQITKWYLRHVILGRVPPEKNEKYGVYDVFILFSLTKASNYFQSIFFLNLGVMVLFSFVLTWISLRINDDRNYSNFSSRQRGKIQDYLLNRLILSLLKNLCLIAMCCYFFNWRFQSSVFISTIPTKTRPAFPNMTATVYNRPMAGVRMGNLEFVTPTRDDVLIGTRFDSLYLGIVNRFFDYHTGNIHWRKLVRDAAETIDRSYIFSSLPHAADAIIDSILYKIDGNLLLQSPESGNFTVMTRGESRLFTRRALLLEKSLLILELDRSISFMIAHFRFDANLRATPLALFSVKVLEEIRKNIFGEESSLPRSFPSEDDHQKLNIAVFQASNIYPSARRSSSQFQLLTLLKPLKKFVPTLQPEDISSHKQLGKPSTVTLKLHSVTKVNNRNRKRRARADVILELNKNKKRQR